MYQLCRTDDFIVLNFFKWVFEYGQKSEAFAKYFVSNDSAKNQSSWIYDYLKQIIEEKYFVIISIPQPRPLAITVFEGLNKYIFMWEKNENSEN